MVWQIGGKSKKPPSATRRSLGAHLSAGEISFVDSGATTCGDRSCFSEPSSCGPRLRRPELRGYGCVQRPRNRSVRFELSDELPSRGLPLSRSIGSAEHMG